MNEFIEKLIGRLEEQKSEVNGLSDIVWNNAVKMCIYEVNQLAEEYNGGFCEHTLGSGVTSCGKIFSGDSESGRCPYCGKKIKVVE